MQDMSMSSMNSSSSSMVFTTDHTTSLFSAAWTPASGGAYAGTCIFLVILAIISRLLLAYRTLLEIRWRDWALRRRYVVVAGENDEQREKQLGLKDREDDEAVLTKRGVDERVRVVRASGRRVERQPWRFSTDLPRACIFTVQAGVAYLLMLAVMTLNAGYFLSVLAGLFVGELAVGRYTQMDDHH